MLQDFEICDLTSSKDYELTCRAVIFEYSERLFAVIQRREYIVVPNTLGSFAQVVLKLRDFKDEKYFLIASLC